MAVKQIDLGEVVGPKGDTGPKEIGRASCRERV